MSTPNNGSYNYSSGMIPLPQDDNAINPYDDMNKSTIQPPPGVIPIPTVSAAPSVPLYNNPMNSNYGAPYAAPSQPSSPYVSNEQNPLTSSSTPISQQYPSYNPPIPTAPIPVAPVQTMNNSAAENVYQPPSNIFPSTNIPVAQPGYYPNNPQVIPNVQPSPVAPTVSPIQNNPSAAIPMVIPSNQPSYSNPVNQYPCDNSIPQAIYVNLGKPSDYPITHEQIRNALCDFVSKKFMWSKSTAKNCILQNIDTTISYRIHFETFLDSRSVKWEYEPCSHTVDGPENGVPQPPFDINVIVPTMFNDTTVKHHIEHTDFSRDCLTCKCKGSVTCSICDGKGFMPCTICNSTGRDDEGRKCTICKGSGRKGCLTCSSRGSVKCSKCEGKRMLIVYAELTTRFHTDNAYNYIDKTGIPQEQLKEGSGDIVYEDCGYMINPPLLNAPEIDTIIHTLKTNSDDLINHEPCRIIQQRITVTRLPVTCVTASIKDQTFMFWVYGKNNKCFCSDYVKKFGNCSIF
ncbi:hypothetical protein WA158_003683 [Blastocystis sp. Blastoise]